MIFYLSNIIVNPDVIVERNAVMSGAGYHRVLYIANCVKEAVTIVSMGAGQKKGLYPKKSENISDMIRIEYLPDLNIVLFGKNIRHIFYSFLLTVYLFRRLKKNDRMIVYNTENSFFMIIPVLTAKLFIGFDYVLELEELYSYRRDCKKLGLAERLSIKFAKAYIAVTEIQTNYFDRNKPRIVIGGYKTFTDPQRGIPATSTSIPIVIYSGRLDANSGIDVFLESINMFKERCKVCITGNGVLLEKVKQFSNVNTLVDYSYLGLLERESYEDLLWSAKVGINPLRSGFSFSDVSFPSKILQYLEFGNIVVSSEIVALSQLSPMHDFIVTYKGDSPSALAHSINVALGTTVHKRQIIDIVNDYIQNQEKTLNSFWQRIWS